MIVNRRTNYPAVWIKDPIDNSIIDTPREAGWIMGVGYMPIGNPLQALHITSYKRALLSTIPANGGNVKNKVAYHLKDYFREYNGVCKLGRILGIDSTVSLIAVTDDGTGTGTLEVDEATLSEVSIYNGAMRDYGDSAPTELMEVLVMLAPAESFTVRLQNKSGEITVTMHDAMGEEVAYYVGSADTNAVDDYGVSSYIGNIVDSNVLKVQVNTLHSDYVNTFDITTTFDSGLVTDVGVIPYSIIETQLLAVSGDCDYVMGFENTDSTMLDALVSVADSAGISTVIDIVAPTLTQAISDKNSLAFGDNSSIMYVWNRIKYSFTTGNQNIGLGGFLIGHRVNRNITGAVRLAEARMNGVAGVRYPITEVRTPADDVVLLTHAEKTLATTERLNTVDVMRGQLVISDILSATSKETYMKLHPVADTDNFISRTLGRLIEDELFANMSIALDNLRKTVRVFFNDCYSANYFDKTVVSNLVYDISSYNGDTIVITYEWIPAGVVRKGEVQPIIGRVERTI